MKLEFFSTYLKKYIQIPKFHENRSVETELYHLDRRKRDVTKLRQKQLSGSNLAFLRAHANLGCVVVVCVSRSVAVRLNICSKLV